MGFLGQQMRTTKGLCVCNTCFPTTSFSRAVWVSDKQMSTNSRVAGTQKEQCQFYTDWPPTYGYRLYGMKLFCSNTVVYSYFLSFCILYFIFPQEQSTNDISIQCIGIIKLVSSLRPYSAACLHEFFSQRLHQKLFTAILFEKICEKHHIQNSKNVPSHNYYSSGLAIIVSSLKICE